MVLPGRRLTQSQPRRPVAAQRTNTISSQRLAAHRAQEDDFARQRLELLGQGHQAPHQPVPNQDLNDMDIDYDGPYYQANIPGPGPDPWLSDANQTELHQYLRSSTYQEKQQAKQQTWNQIMPQMFCKYMTCALKTSQWGHKSLWDHDYKPPCNHEKRARLVDLVDYAGV